MIWRPAACGFEFTGLSCAGFRLQLGSLLHAAVRAGFGRAYGTVFVLCFWGSLACALAVVGLWVTVDSPYPKLACKAGGVTALQE